MFLHVDGDAFFASCEISLNPRLKGKPVVTGQERGIVSAMSYEAKALGIKRAMPIFKLRKEFPQVIVVSSDYHLYEIFSRRMVAIVRRHASLVEEYSIDECFADLTPLESDAHFSPEGLARKIKEDLESMLGMTFSVGVGPTKVLAKVASKWKKPSGLTLISREGIDSYLEKLPIENVWGIGRETAVRLWRLKIRTAREFTQKSEEWIKEHFNRPQLELWLELRGVSVRGLSLQNLATDSSELVPEVAQKSISNTGTFSPKTSDTTRLLSELSHHVESACSRARQIGALFQDVSFFLKTQQFEYHSTQFRLVAPTNVPKEVMKGIQHIFSSVHDPACIYRATGVTLRSLSPVSLRQGDLLSGLTMVGGSSIGENPNDLSHVYQTIDTLSQRFGRNALFLGSSLGAFSARGVKPLGKKDLDIPFMGEVS